MIIIVIDLLLLSCLQMGEAEKAAGESEWVKQARVAAEELNKKAKESSSQFFEQEGKVSLGEKKKHFDLAPKGGKCALPYCKVDLE